MIGQPVNASLQKGSCKPMPGYSISTGPGKCRRVRFSLLIGIFLVIAGCGKEEKNLGRVLSSLDLIERLEPVNHMPSYHIRKHMPVTRRGDRRSALVLIAPVTVRASLRGLQGSMKLTGFAAPVFNIGDGVRMEVFLSRAGVRQLLGVRYFDAARKIEDRSWVGIEFPLELTGDDELEIEVSAGPLGDLVADWLALDSLRLTAKEVEK